ncbi:RagB/SusD family nutrient uptake outer membrane protein [Chitinophaga agrisoli]|uniref:RagB/SusD family nutrient uptake outer membrane protein n=1 Tax=Chitinophaga agrisoli TaxID=2607653 RepID=A0A5B2VQ88_9BACT|nr:RagB/SusD family nutrient uptake outer membrane protein [Chitinophaga agrisoli]KAA2240387.1 RagB/SusD family nutrient uptake outer membrane protein [Chitinophaga agrisoli]
MKKYLILIITIAALSSCSKWLDVTPKSQVSQDALFSTEDGFKEALNGLYSRCAQTDLYGVELTVGLPEVLAQNYALGTLDVFHYQQTALFNYKDDYFLIKKDSAWQGLYNVIANSNQILDNIDKQKAVLTPAIYAIIKGEALAMRAYCHFDALRMFAVSYLLAPNGSGIPYVTAFSKDVPKMYKTSEALDLMIKDLLAAKELLAADPIRSPAYKVGYNQTDSSTENDGELFMQNRRHRLNYYAVCGELARVYLYKGDNANALANALEVINANKFPFTKQADFMNPNEQTKDRILYKELVFGFYIPNTSDQLRTLLRNADQGLYTTTAGGRNIYETGGVGGDDFRFKQWVTEQTSGNGTYLRIDKYARDPDANLHPQMAPAIRLSEMYYIAAECTFDSNPAKAWDYFNTVRQNRGIGTKRNDASKTVLIQELLKEARKEFFAEGQIFYMYKRLNQPIIGLAGNPIAAGNSIFVLPFPNDEIAYGHR